MTTYTIPSCSAQAADETLPDYAARVLKFILTEGPHWSLTDEQLAQADSAAQRAVFGLPAKLDAADALVNARLGNARLEIARVQRERRDLQLVTLSPKFVENAASEAAATAAAIEKMSREEAVGQMFADLVRLATGKSNGKGPDDGKKVKLQKPVKPVPPGGDALFQPNAPRRPQVSQ